MFTYHYCAQYQEQAGRIEFIDGIATCSHKIKSKDDYELLKVSISGEFAESLVVISLTLI